MYTAIVDFSVYADLIGLVDVGVAELLVRFGRNALERVIKGDVELMVLVLLGCLHSSPIQSGKECLEL